MDILLRPALVDDVELLYRWRIDPGTRLASLNTESISLQAHQAWFRSVLADPARRLYIAECQGIPVGTVRTDGGDDACELSWTVAPEFRGRGIGTRMVMMVAASTPGILTARVKADNVASVRIAEAAGMRLDREADGVLHFLRAHEETTAGMSKTQAESTPRRERLALDGGSPVRTGMLRYAGQAVDESDIAAVDAVLRGEWLTTGPAVREFEANLCGRTGARFAVAVNTGTAALHLAAAAAGIGPGDEVIVPAISFVASANCVLYQGGRPVFADLCRDTLNIDPADVERRITPRTRAVVAVDFAGHPCDHDALSDLARRYQLTIIEDAAHSLGAVYRGKRVGTLQPLTTLSFHPVKHITTGEGGAIVTDDVSFAKAVRSLRHHGIDLDLHARNAGNSWEYERRLAGIQLSDSGPQLRPGHQPAAETRRMVGAPAAARHQVPRGAEGPRDA